MSYNKDFFEKEIYTNSNRLKEKFIIKNYYDFYLFIVENYEGESFLQKLYNFYKGDHKCYCGNNTKFVDFKKGYLKRIFKLQIIFKENIKFAKNLAQ